MKPILSLTRYQLVMLVRSPEYWVLSLILAGLAMIAVGYLFSNPTIPRLGVVDEARNEQSAAFLARASEIDGFHVRVGTQDDLLAKLRSGDLWAVVVLPHDFGTESATQSVDIWTGATGEYSAITGLGVLRQLLNEAGAQNEAIAVEERPIDGERPLRLIDFMVPGQVGLSLLVGNLFAANMLAWWREEGVLKRLAASPISARQLLGAQILAYGSLSLAQAAVLLTMGSLLFAVSIRGSYLALAIAIVLGILAFLSLWYGLVSSIRSPIAVVGVGNLMAVVMIFVGGSFLPLKDPPSFLQPITAVAPLNQLNDALREVMNRGQGLQGIASNLAVLATWAAALFYAATRVFRWTSDY